MDTTYNRYEHVKDPIRQLKNHEIRTEKKINIIITDCGTGAAVSWIKI